MNIPPLKAMADQATPADVDQRDALFSPAPDENYSAPASPLLPPAVPENTEGQAGKQEAVKKTEALRPLG